jgi:mediator of RNA polymerase II transcription subunit 12, fungi type
MDWLLSTLEASSYARLPMWILVVQIYWKDLLSLRKYGRRLVTCLLNHQQGVRDRPNPSRSAWRVAPWLVANR